MIMIWLCLQALAAQSAVNIVEKDCLSCPINSSVAAGPLRSHALSNTVCFSMQIVALCELKDVVALFKCNIYSTSHCCLIVCSSTFLLIVMFKFFYERWVFWEQFRGYHMTNFKQLLTFSHMSSWQSYVYIYELCIHMSYVYISNITELCIHMSYVYIWVMYTYGEMWPICVP